MKPTSLTNRHFNIAKYGTAAAIRKGGQRVSSKDRQLTGASNSSTNRTRPFKSVKTVGGRPYFGNSKGYGYTSAANQLTHGTGAWDPGKHPRDSNGKFR